MNHIDQIQKLMKQSKSISEFTEALKNADIPAWYMIEAEESIKKEHGINVNEKWHRFFAETDSTPINQWEKIASLYGFYNPR